MADMVGLEWQRIPQRDDELPKLVDFMIENGVRSYLEIGLQKAMAFHYIGSRLPKGTKMVGVDLPGSRWGLKDGTGPGWIEKVRVELTTKYEQDVHIILADSRERSTIEKVENLGPFDCIFIDADHAYEAVKIDWQNYGPMGRMVAFHDIDTPNHYGMTPQRLKKYGVHTLWGQIKDNFRHVEIVGNDRGMGIGVLWRD